VIGGCLHDWLRLFGVSGSAICFDVDPILVLALAKYRSMQTRRANLPGCLMVATTSSWRPAMVLWPPAHRRGYGENAIGH
jgi:hypothetical protein